MDAMRRTLIGLAFILVILAGLFALVSFPDTSKDSDVKYAYPIDKNGYYVTQTDIWVCYNWEDAAKLEVLDSNSLEFSDVIKKNTCTIIYKGAKLDLFDTENKKTPALMARMRMMGGSIERVFIPRTFINSNTMKENKSWTNSQL